MVPDIDLAIFLISVLVFFSVLLYHPARYYGIPALLIFMGVGIGLGNGGYDKFIYDFPELTNTISSLALNLIIFAGGMHTSIKRIKPVMAEGLTLSTLGVLATAMILGTFIYIVTGLGLLESILLGAVVSSTDSAAVFSILESKKLKLRENTDTTLEFESATNDPMAMLLTLGLTMLILDPSISNQFFILFFIKQLGIGAVAGIVFGFLAGWILKKITFQEVGLVPIFILAIVGIATLGGELLGGNRLLAAYIIGVTIGNQEFSGKDTSLHFFNSISWLSQAIMFLLLGLQIFPGELVQFVGNAILLAILLIFVARPVSVFMCMLFNKSSWRKKVFISWVGLKGATPIVFAFIPVLQGVDQANKIFNMVFFVVVISILIQGTTIGKFAKWLKLEEKGIE